MTEIVDERQRLVERTLMTSIKAGRTPRETAIDIAAALASPSEGNKKGGEHTVSDTGGGFYRVLDPQGDVVGTFISREHADEYAQRCTARLASRPQEQPRKATGEMVKVAHEFVDGYPISVGYVEDMLNAALAVMPHSPAAAQGWQSGEMSDDDKWAWLRKNGSLRELIAHTIRTAKA